jgi:hypothetical protein
MKLKTVKNKTVKHGKIYKVKYRSGGTYEYGYGIYRPEKHINVDILCDEGGVIYLPVQDVIFIKRYK